MTGAAQTNAQSSLPAQHMLRMMSLVTGIFGILVHIKEHFTKDVFTYIIIIIITQFLFNLHIYEYMYV